MLPGVVGGLAVQLGDGVRPVGEAEAEGGHVELVRVVVDAAAQGQDVVDRDAPCPGPPLTREERPGDAPDEAGVEPLVAGRDRRVDREGARAPDGRPGVGEGRARADHLAGALHEQERGVALVEVPDRRRDVQGAEGAHAADAQDELLVEPHLAAADVEDVGDRPVGLVVARVVRVEQENRHAAHLEHPDGDVDGAAGQLHGDVERIAHPVEDPEHREAGEVEVGVGVLLVAVRVDRLAEVALAVEQAHAHERQGHVAGALHVVAGEDAQAARVDPERLVEAVLGAEVGDRARQLPGVGALEPVVGAVLHVPVELGEDVLVLGDERRVVQQRLPVDGALEEGDRVAVAGPGRGVDALEEERRARVPHPPQVVGEATQALEPGRQPERRAGQGGDADEGFHTGRDDTAPSAVHGRTVGRAGCVARAPRPRGLPSTACASSSSPPSASRGPRPAGWATSSTPWRVLSVAFPASSTSRSRCSCRATARCTCRPTPPSRPWPCACPTRAPPAA